MANTSGSVNDSSTQENNGDLTAALSLLRQAESLLSGNSNETTQPQSRQSSTTRSTAVAPVADRAMENFRQLFAPYSNNRLSSSPSASLGQGRARALSDPPNKRRKSNQSRSGRSIVMKDTWTHDFMCLANHVQHAQPTRREKLSLQAAGLGRKTLTFGRTDHALAFVSKIETVYPKIKTGGGFELLRSGASNKEIILITPLPSGYTVPFLRESSGIGQALIYVRPIQKSLATDPAPLFQVLYMHFNYYMYIQGDLLWVGP
jgi:hypothetical protein